MEEQFKSIKNYEGLYEISNRGNVKSLAKSWVIGGGHIRKKPETILRPGVDTRGYFHVRLCKDGKTRSYAIHPLVWDHFGDKARDGRKLQIDHIDGNKLNNYRNNLQLLTQRQNTNKGYSDKKRSGLPTNVFRNGNRFQAKIHINGKCLYIGTFQNVDEASVASQKFIGTYLSEG